MFGGYFYYFDPTYILILIGVVLSLFASAKMKSTFAKYSKVRSYTGMTGAQAAERLLQAEGIYDVRVEHISGNLTDHYDPKGKVLRLSDTVYQSTSVAALGVAAHECGHAIQHKEGYAPLKIRGSMVPAVNIGAQISWPLIFVGIIFSSLDFLIQFGIILFSLTVLFQLVTLPVEFNASRRALAALERNHILQEVEIKSTRKVLTAAALTYVAAAAASILQLLRLLILFGGRRDDD
ncbi:MAG: zinc metallopeptidase [Lachnospiraceae bacterium]|nr:zinc metallopeptidase [Lachnospiraceae bacterium]